MLDWIKKMFSDANGVPDDARVAAFLVVLTFCGNALYALYRGQIWDPQAFGIGAGAIAAGFGAWFGIRKEH